MECVSGKGNLTWSLALQLPAPWHFVLALWLVDTEERRRPCQAAEQCFAARVTLDPLPSRRSWRPSQRGNGRYRECRCGGQSGCECSVGSGGIHPAVATGARRESLGYCPQELALAAPQWDRGGSLSSAVAVSGAGRPNQGHRQTGCLHGKGVKPHPATSDVCGSEPWAL